MTSRKPVKQTVLITVLLLGLIAPLFDAPLAHQNPDSSAQSKRSLSPSERQPITPTDASEKQLGLAPFLPHGVCFLWDETLLLLHVVSDSLIALSYFSIPVALLVFVRRRKDLAFSWIFCLFATFIVACGTTHIMGVWTIWKPSYWLDGIIKALTATVSLITSVLLWPLIPKAVALPSPAQLEAANQDLQFQIQQRNRDIAERRSLEDQLKKTNEELVEQNHRVQEANRLKSEFLANMSHELRTPLNGVIGFAELMHDGKVGPISSNHKEYLSDILGSAKHLLQLINDVLDLSKIEAGKLEFNPAPVNLELVVAEVRDTLRTLAANKRIHVETEVDPVLSEIVGDVRNLKQVLYNYLSNAIKFTPEGGSVALRFKPDRSDRFRIEVSDNGIGIKAEDTARLFVEFQQLDAGSAKKFPGTGLGLALTKKIVEAQGGWVGVRSMPGLGSTFFAVLPRVCHSIREINKDTGPDAAWSADATSRAS
jgi:signal transduction histidine kinase